MGDSNQTLLYLGLSAFGIVFILLLIVYSYKFICSPLCCCVKLGWIVVIPSLVGICGVLCGIEIGTNTYFRCSVKNGDFLSIDQEKQFGCLEHFKIEAAIFNTFHRFLISLKDHLIKDSVFDYKTCKLIYREPLSKIKKTDTFETFEWLVIDTLIPLCMFYNNNIPESVKNYGLIDFGKKIFAINTTTTTII